VITFLLGADDYSKKQYLEDLAKSSKADLEFYFADSEPLDVLRLSEQDLFSKPKIFALENVFGNVDWREGDLEKIKASENQIVILEEALDKRLSKNKQILSDKNIKVLEFNPPHGKEINKWIENKVKVLGGQISSNAIEELALRLGRDEAEETKFGGKVISVREIFSLWQAESEIKKLMAYCGNREIAGEDVKNLVNENWEVDSLQIANAIGDKDGRLAFDLIGKFLKDQNSADEKGAIIQLNALLAEQFRNVFLTQDFLSRRVLEAEILKKTGWKSGRLFVMKKIAQRFPRAKIFELLNKLEALDEELKTSATPPKTLLDLILSQLLY
jgi:DNA polymerase III delta subunit